MEDLAEDALPRLLADAVREHRGPADLHSADEFVPVRLMPHANVSPGEPNWSLGDLPGVPE